MTQPRSLAPSRRSTTALARDLRILASDPALAKTCNDAADALIDLQDEHDQMSRAARSRFRRTVRRRLSPERQTAISYAIQAVRGTGNRGGPILAATVEMVSETVDTLIIAIRDMESGRRRATPGDPT